MTDGKLLDLFPMGMVVLDVEARVRIVNAQARSVFDAGDGLQLADGRVVAPRREDAAALARLFHGPCPHLDVAGLHARGSLQIGRARGRSKLTVLLADRHVRAGGPATELVLFLHEPDARVLVSESTLRALYGLTRAEARITARLVERGATTGLAAESGVTPNTLRTHLKRVFGKLGVRSQSGLIRVVLSGPAALPLDGDPRGGEVRSTSERRLSPTGGAS